MSAGNDEPRYTRLLRRMLWFALGVAAVTLGMIWATMLTTGQAAAQPLNIPGIGTIDVPDQARIPERLEPGLHQVPVAPQMNSSRTPHGVSDPAHPIVRSAVGYVPAAGTGHAAVGAAAIPSPAHPAVFAPDIVRSLAGAVPDIAYPDGASMRGMVRSAVGSVPASRGGRGAVAPIPGVVRYVGTPAYAPIGSTGAVAPGDSATTRAFTFGPAPVPGAAQSAGLPPAPDIPTVRQLLSAPQLRGLNIPGLTLPQFQPAPQSRPATHETTGERALDAARSKLGATYRYGSAGPDAFDCSGLVQWSYRQAGVALPRTSYGQLDSGTPVPLNQLQPGDLVSFYGGGHSAIYAGNGRVIHASTERTGVTESPISQMPVAGARRF